jgi:predicted acyl esterase
MKNVKCAVLVVGGWYDAEDLSGPYRTFNAINKFNPDTPTTLVEGPWVHGGWARGEGNHLGDIQFDANASEYFRAHIQFPFFEHYLKGKWRGSAKAVVFETGTNVWHSLDAWPPKAAAPKTLYFHAGGKLSFDPPEEIKGVDEYVSDPNHPVPFVGYTTDTVPQRYMVDDQRFASYRPDVLVYQTEPLDEDVTIAGPISPRLKIASSGTDSDFDVKLIDVYPDDYPGQEIPGRPSKRVMDAAAAHGRLPGAAARGTFPRQVPLKLGEARAADARQRGRGQFHHARSLPHIPSRPSHHGPGAELLVPADGSQSTNLHGHSQCQTGTVPEGHGTGISPEGCRQRRGSAGASKHVDEDAK